MVKGTLFVKSLRDMQKSKVQFISIFIMATLAVSIITGLDSIWKSIQDHAGLMYSAANLSDMWINVVNPTEKELWSIKGIKGVEEVEKRYSGDAIADLYGSPTLHVYTISDKAKLDLPNIVQGKFTSKGGVLLDAVFADRRGLKIGDNVSIKINGKWLSFPVEGLALSSEHIFSAKGTTSLLPDPKMYGFIIVNEDSLMRAYGQKFYNQISVKLSAGAGRNAVERRIDDALGDALIGTVAKADNKSVSDVNANIQQFKTLALIFPLMFFLVTALVTQSTMVRMVENQRSEIGILKALGYTKGSILWHYTSYGVYLGILGAAAGVLLGPNIFGRILIPMLKLNFSGFRIEINFPKFILSVILILICTGGVSFYACLRLQLDTPAVLLRDKPPKEGSHIFIEYFTKLWDSMRFSRKLIARNTLKNKARLTMSVMGITGCAGLIIAAFAVSNMINGISKQIYKSTFTYDQKIILESKADSRYIHNLSLDGIVQQVEEQALEVICPDGSRKMELLSIYSKESPLIHLKDTKGNEVQLPEDGITVTRKLAETLRLKPGDSLKIKRPDHDYVSVPVKQIVYIASGQSMYMTDKYWESINEKFKPTAILVKWNNKPDEKFLQGDYVKEYVNREKQQSDIDSNTKVVYIAAVMLVAMGAILAFVVLYNSSILNFSERIRDLATFRVLGFYHGEIRSLMLMENILCVILGTIFGIPVGKVIAYLAASGLDDQMDLISHVSFGIVVLAGAITLIFASVINKIVAEKMKTIDMLEALKSVE